MLRCGHLICGVTVTLLNLSLVWASDNSTDLWQRHTIDKSSKGADGVRLADVNGDRHKDITTGWEEGGVIRVYLNPGSKKARGQWPTVTVGKVTSAEDAVFADLDGDGAVDVISSCEGGTQCMFVHWAPRNKTDYLSADAWTTQAIPATRGATRWMFAMPMDVDGRHGVDLIVASKAPNAMIGWLEAPADARNLDAWKLHRLYDASWIMSLRKVDLDRDGDLDVIASDRKGQNAQVLWLENPGAAAAARAAAWNHHTIGAKGREVMFLDLADFNGDGRLDVIAPARQRDIVMLFQPDDLSEPWKQHVIRFPDTFGTSKGVRAADINLDGRIDLAVTCENAKGNLSGVFWLSYNHSVMDKQWDAHDIGGPVGVKYDRIEMLDADGDGDLDLFSCEERDQLGVFWYENPAR